MNITLMLCPACRLNVEGRKEATQCVTKGVPFNCPHCKAYYEGKEFWRLHDAQIDLAIPRGKEQP